VQLHRIRSLDPVGKLDAAGRRENLSLAGRVAQACRGVDGAADVVVAVHQQYEATRDASPKRQPARRSGSLFDGDDGTDDPLALDAHHHHAVAEPLLDAYTEKRRDLAHDLPQAARFFNCGFVALGVSEVGEPTEVDEAEAALDSARVRNGL
jgi:hypothetical protein